MSYDIRYLLHRLISMQYKRSDIDFSRSTFRLRGDTLEIYPAYGGNTATRIEFFGDEVEKISDIHPLAGPYSKIDPMQRFSLLLIMSLAKNRFNMPSNRQAELSERIEYFQSEKQTNEAQRIASHSL